MIASIVPAARGGSHDGGEARKAGTLCFIQSRLRLHRRAGQQVVAPHGLQKNIYKTH